MDIQTALAIFAAFVMWTGTTAGVLLWLQKQFSETRTTMYRLHKENVDAGDRRERQNSWRFDVLNLRLIACELKLDPKADLVSIHSPAEKENG